MWLNKLRSLYPRVQTRTQKNLQLRKVVRCVAGSITLASFLSFSYASAEDNVGRKINAPPQDCSKDAIRVGPLDIGPYQIPHDKKREKGGEDTYFVSANGKVVGVFDGVGGWAKKGVDPRQYSYALSTGCKEGVDKKGLLDPLEILNYGHKSAMGVIGSSTAVVVSIDDNNLSGINLGDSGFLVVRNETLFYVSPSQQHRPNMPYQLGSNNRNVPADGATISFALKPGDIMVLASDGVLDNLSVPDIVEIVAASPKKTRAKEISQIICSDAYKFSHTENGKPDDITALVVKYEPQSPA